MSEKDDENQVAKKLNWIKPLRMFNLLLLVPSIAYLALVIAFYNHRFSYKVGIIFTVLFVVSIIYAVSTAFRSSNDNLSTKEKYITLSPLFFLFLLLIPMIMDVARGFIEDPFRLENIFGLAGFLFYLVLFFVIIKYIRKRYSK